MSKILIVDDNKNMNLVFCEFFKNHGHETIPCFSGNEALDLLVKSEDIDYAFIDLKMPEKSGYEVINEYEADTNIVNKAQIFVMSGDVDKSQLLLKYKSVIKILHKPFDIEDILTYINK